METGLVSAIASADQQKVIKDPPEQNAYINASNTPDFLDKAAALEAFVARYPASVVKIDALEQAMEAYQLGGNLLKAEETAKRLAAADDANVRALVVLTFMARSQLAEGNLAKLNDLCTSSRRGVAVLPSWQKPEGLTDEDFSRMKSGVAEILYGGAGFYALNHKTYNVARSAYLKALAINSDDIVNNYQLGFAGLESSPVEPEGFRYVAKAIRLAKATS
jgi:tetratricopeptide (TPR) repeat protein